MEDIEMRCNEAFKKVSDSVIHERNFYRIVWDAEEIVCVYYNPEGNDGKGQFCEHHFPLDFIEGTYANEEVDKTADLLFGNAYSCPTYIYDFGTEGFADMCEEIGSYVEEPILDNLSAWLYGLVRIIRIAESSRKYPVDALEDLVYALKMDDIEVDEENGFVVMRDNETVWSGNEVYEFLFNEALMLKEDLSLVKGFFVRDDILAPALLNAIQSGAQINYCI